MKLIYKILAILLILSILLSYLVFTSYVKKSSVKAPDFVFTDTDENKHNLSDFFGKVILLDFMATWCDPCIKMIENIKEVNERYPELIIISIDIDPTESIEEIKKFKDKYGANWLFVLDKEEINKKYGVVGIPKTIIINPSGEISYSHSGVVSPSKLSDEIEKAKLGFSRNIFLFNLGLPAIAIIAGILSFFSPCSFPLLPAYIGYYLGRRKIEEKKKIQLLVEGITKGIQPALGILSFYALIGISIIFLGDSIKYFLPLFEPFIGVIIIFLGIIMILKLPVFLKFSSSLTTKLSPLIGNQKFSLFLYGIIYGAASAGCTMPIFISTLLIAISFGSFFSGIIIFLLYVAGMMGLMIVITILIAFSADAISKLKLISKYVERIGGALLIFAGLLLIYYSFT